MTIIDKFLSLPDYKQELIIDQLVSKVKSTGDVKFAIKILSNNLGVNGSFICDRVKAKLDLS